ncbi:hypothetical protein [Phormidesmis sp. 146-33]
MSMKALFPFRSAIVTIVLLIAVGVLGYTIELSFPVRAPKLENTYTPTIQKTPQEVGSFDVLGSVVSKREATKLLETAEGRASLAPENGAVEITQDLIDLGRDAFYRETFGNEYFFTDVLGVIDGKLNLISIGKAIAALGGKHTTNLQVPLDEDVTIGSRLFRAGSVVNTGLDVPAGSLIPLGMQTFKQGAKIRVGITCAACHAAVDKDTGRILEGAPNNDLDTGLLQAFATNSAAMFRQTGVNPTKIPLGDRTYINAAGQTANLPDAKAVEDAVDAQLVGWAPGNFDSTGDNHNNPSQNPSSYTFESYPYGWSGFSSVGWFHGLSTLNNNVHATNSDPTTGSYASQPILGIDKETYLGIMLQNAADRRFRLPNGAKPSEFLVKGDPTPGNPAMNEVIKMPGYPRGSIFIVDGLMANSPGYPVGQQINAMSAYQNTLAPPPTETRDRTALQRGAAVFEKANCAQCHSGRYFTNHSVIGASEIKSQPSRAAALKQFPKTFISPETYPPNTPVPVPPDPPVLAVPIDITPQSDRDLSYAVGNEGGYKVPNLIGLSVTAPYLHDGGVAASQDAISLSNPQGVELSSNQFVVSNPDHMGIAGTSMQGILPDPAASLRVLVDRTLRQVAVNANRKNRDLQIDEIDGSGHEYWIDPQAGFTTQEQTDLIQFLLSIDDDPAILPKSVSTTE